MIKKTLVMGAVVLGLAYNPAVFARDYITIVGSSTVYPFATAVAEQFGKTGGFKTPKIESTGTGGGMKLFCAGVGVKHPDIANGCGSFRTTLRPVRPPLRRGRLPSLSGGYARALGPYETPSRPPYHRWSGATGASAPPRRCAGPSVPR